VKNKAFGAFFR